MEFVNMLVLLLSHIYNIGIYSYSLGRKKAHYNNKSLAHMADLNLSISLKNTFKNLLVPKK